MRDALDGFVANVVCVNLCRFCFSVPFRLLKPIFNEVLVDFEVKLKTIHLVAVAKRLMATRRGRGEVDRTLGHLEGVAVPLKEILYRTKVLQHGIVTALVGEGHFIPANFFDGIPANG